MKIIVNGKQADTSATSLDLALIELGFNSPAIATAVNGIFVAATNRPDTVLLKNDQLEVLAPMKGG